MSEPDDYQTQLAKWKTTHGLDPKIEQNQDELQMAAEEQASKEKGWCFGCDKHMPVREMKLITRRIDPYRQMDEEGFTGYIAKTMRVRMCPECFKEEYESDE